MQSQLRSWSHIPADFTTLTKSEHGEVSREESEPLISVLPFVCFFMSRVGKKYTETKAKAKKRCNGWLKGWERKQSRMCYKGDLGRALLEEEVS